MEELLSKYEIPTEKHETWHTTVEVKSQCEDSLCYKHLTDRRGDKLSTIKDQYCRLLSGLYVLYEIYR